jgi:ribosomal protein L32
MKKNEEEEWRRRRRRMKKKKKKTPHNRKLIIAIANYPNRLCPYGNYTAACYDLIVLSFSFFAFF